MRYMEILTSSVADFRKLYPKVFEVPFNSTNKYHITINDDYDMKGHWLCMKGAPERVIEKCSSIYKNGTEVALNDRLRKEFMDAYMELGGLGERVIGRFYISLNS